ncbi:peptidylprolyl isomerase [Ferruginivarius sediminum]|uniref:Parvulin-like PPIase n=1 Tax=Ferruginivarius sediminum TaxID=2661937 RepID=A0A369TE24_9PROT|nr:peptidylprolyl isomerase [Ferruginivarius sediminum]RDD62407.1 peptidyl-prolyl cis-trans isomerase [Ferruginivarius sediminum]
MHMMRGLRSLLLALAIVGLAAPAAAQQALRAAALVNDEVISIMDLEMRVRLVMTASGISGSAEQRNRLAPQVLRSIIDERLQMQEAARLGIEAQDAEIDNAIARIAQQNNMAPRQFLDVLRRNGILPQVFRNQIRAKLLWQKVIAREIRREIQISPEEVDSVVERLMAQEGERRLRVREIFLSVDAGDEEQEVRATAQRLTQQLRNGAEFSSLARQFSQAATAAVGGDLGWLTPGSLPDQVANTLDEMQPGQIAGPIRTFGGYYIVRLEDTRQIAAIEETVNLKQIYLPLPGDAASSDIEEARARAEELAGQVDSCESMSNVAKSAGSANSGSLGEVKLSSLPENIRGAVADLPIDTPSRPIEVNAGIAVLMVCERSQSGIDRDQIRENLARQQLDLRAQRYMRDLRRAAHVDIRL